MEEHEARLGATLIVWLAVVAIFVFGSPNTSAQDLLVPVAAVVTLAMWIAPLFGRGDSDKAKRHSAATADIDANEIRLRVLMDLLGEEDKARMRAKLMNGFSDGELPVDEFIEDTSRPALHSDI